MKRIAFATVAGALVSLAALGGAAAANAQTFGHVSVNIGLPTPPIAVMRPAPVVVAPHPQRVWGPPPQAHGHYGHQGRYGHDRGDYYRHGRGDGYYRDGRGYYATRWDRDGDGVPNRHDRRPHNPYRN
ncbi:hypothetical protein ACIPRI_17555 [Variovorax sp. LARHSF232]